MAPATSYLALFYLGVKTFFQKRWVDWLFFLLATVFAGTTANHILTNNFPSSIIHISWPTRLLIVPTLVAFGVLAMINFLRKNSFSQTYALIVLVPTILSNISFDGYNSYFFKQGITHFKQKMKTNKGCRELDRDEFFNDLFKYGLMPSFLQDLSLIYTHALDFETLLVAEFTNFISQPPPYFDTCRSFTSRGYSFTINYHYMYVPLHLPEMNRYKVGFQDRESARVMHITQDQDFYKNLGHIAFDSHFNKVRLNLNSTYSLVKFKAIFLQEHPELEIQLQRLGTEQKIAFREHSDEMIIENIGPGEYEIVLKGINQDAFKLPALSPLYVVK